ncbi:WD40-repeat-containing domain-containing protein [Dioscorea alata]|uniref:WD40-repeat-containing domain-containing protein n=1 Tax=Dioscorea alata TaxID=55571 RepID=A0ACB7V457_DIOAL|nr:WD40-repeat-containing domain-containing protein [Dioscorea alata]
MESVKEEKVEEVLYEIRHHARRSVTPDSSQDSVSVVSTGGFRSYLSLQGLKQFREKLGGYKKPRTLKRSFSLFVSPGGEHVAIAAGNQIIILQKDDDYMEPCGIFVSNDQQTTFTNGSWLEPCGILGVTDEASNLYFIQSNGEEISKSSRSQLKLKTPIKGLIFPSNIKLEKSPLIGFIFTEDGLLCHVDVTQQPSARNYPVCASNNQLTKKQHPHNVSCLDFHPDLSLVALVGASSVSVNSKDSAGSYSLYLMLITKNFEAELVFCSPHFEGLFSPLEDHIYPIASPKVTISMKGKYVATLSLSGCVDIFDLNIDQYSLSLHLSGGQYPDMSNNLLLEQKKYLADVINLSWWNDHVLILVKKNGRITMYDVSAGRGVSENDLVFSMPLTEGVKSYEGYVFLLDATSSGRKICNMDTPDDLNVNSENDNQLDTGKWSWSLMSFLSRSVPEMFMIFISNKNYIAALEFASRHGLDKDEVFKAQWLDSDHGTKAISMFLSKIKDQAFVLSECASKVGSTEEITKTLLSYGLHITDQYKFLDTTDNECNLIWDFRLIRLKLLQYRDSLETFVGINMGRFLAQEYVKFRALPLTESAISLAESGKIGALNLLFKRHPYSLSSRILDILSAIPETVPVQTYGQLLPGRSPPNTFALREDDWLECQKMVEYMNQMTASSDVFPTEIILKLSRGFLWPSANELTEWYKKRARDIDNLSGQLDNSLSLVEVACRKGITELQKFCEMISYLHQLIYSDEIHETLSTSLGTWEQLSDYEKFRVMLKGVREDNVVERLRKRAIPFMRDQFTFQTWDSECEVKEHTVKDYKQGDSFLVRWLKEVAAENKLDICLSVIENACGDSPIAGLFKDESELIETTLQCIYLCSLTDQWNIMASILSKLPRKTLRDKSANDDKELSPKHVDKLEKRIKIAEGHVEVGRLLAYYQVPKPISFFPIAQSDEKNVKQLLHLILSKFGRRQPGRSDHDWANMWRDMQCFQEKAFPFLDVEYMLIEFIRGLLKAGKFSLARNYLKGTGTVILDSEKTENLVIQAAREYFFSASSLACIEIWKAKECLNLLPNNKNVQAEADLIDVLTVRLPNLGVTLLPMQFRQIRNPMEIINMAIASQNGVYLNVDELIEIAKLLGLRSIDDIASVEEAIAREAAVAGDLQLAFDLCIALAKKGHGPVWDLCAAIARGPDLDNMDMSSRKKLLGFSLSHCDEESVGELLNAWKEVDLQSQCERLMISTQTCPPNFSVQGSSIVSLPVHSTQDIFDLRASSELLNSPTHKYQADDQFNYQNVEHILSQVSKNSFREDGISLDSVFRENRKILAFSALELPWLQELSGNAKYCEKAIPGAQIPFGKNYISTRAQALVTILYWLAENDFAPKDDLIVSLSKAVMEPPVTDEEDVLGCSFLLNLADAFHGVAIIEEQLKRREVHHEVYSIMNIGMIFSSLHNSCAGCSNPDQRRKLLLHKFQESHVPLRSDGLDQIDQAQSTFWREWIIKLEEQKRLADQARTLEQLIPGVETARFLAGDIKYIKSAIFSFIDSVKLDTRHILKDAVMLADKYGLSRSEVLLRFFGCSLVSYHWENDDILAEISEFREDIVTCAKDVIDMISSVVYPEIEGQNKVRLSYIYSILSACYLRLRRTEDPAMLALLDQGHKHMLEAFQFYKTLEQECQKVSFINALNFKNIADLSDLNFEHFNQEIVNNIHESTVEPLANMVRVLVGIYNDSSELGLISWQDVYKHHVMGLLASLESKSAARSDCVDPGELHTLIGEIALSYDSCKKYIRALSESDALNILGRYCRLCIPCSFSGSLKDESMWKSCLIMLLNFWVKMIDDIVGGENNEVPREKPAYFGVKYLSRSLKVFKRLVTEGEISANHGWCTVSSYCKSSLACGLSADVSVFCQAMVFSGCGFNSVAEVYYDAELTSANLSSDDKGTQLIGLYINLVSRILLDLSRGVSENQKLHLLLSSLSRFGGKYIEDLKKTRHAVWEKLSVFSDNMQLESHVRVYTLELMQSVTGQNLKSLPTELVSQVEPWDAWDGSFWKKDSVSTEQGDNAPRSITSNLVALRSTQLAATISPNIKISPEDLLTLESAVSCFLHISQFATSFDDLHVLQSVLEEWGELFSSKFEKEKTSESLEELNNWSSDDWDEGWEDLPEEPVQSEGKQEGSVCVQPLHRCWMEILKRLVGLSRLDAVLKLLDRSLSKQDGTLLDEDDTQCLLQLVLEIDCFTALKVVLLLPYEVSRIHCLHLIEAKLKDESISMVSAADDGECLMLIAYSGVLRDITNNPAFKKVFSFVCYSVGRIARLCQENLLRCNGDGHKATLNQSLLFARLVFPSFVSELIKARQYLLAGTFVSQWMHLPTSLTLINIIEPSLRKYLEGEVLQAHASKVHEPGLSEMNSYGSLVCTVSCLRDKLATLVQSALSALQTDLESGIAFL